MKMKKQRKPENGSNGSNRSDGTDGSDGVKKKSFGVQLDDGLRTTTVDVGRIWFARGTVNDEQSLRENRCGSVAVMVRTASQQSPEHNEIEACVCEAVRNAIEFHFGTTEQRGKIAGDAKLMERVINGARALFAAEHHDHFASRMSDSEMAAINEMKEVLALLDASAAGKAGGST